MVRRVAVATYRRARQVVVGVIGGTVLATGVALLVLPGPAFVVIPAGLAILSIEFAWARRWLLHARGALEKAATSLPRRSGSAPPELDPPRR